MLVISHEDSIFGITRSLDGHASLLLLSLICKQYQEYPRAVGLGPLGLPVHDLNVMSNVERAWESRGATG